MWAHVSRFQRPQVDQESAAITQGGRTTRRVPAPAHRGPACWGGASTCETPSIPVCRKPPPPGRLCGPQMQGPVHSQLHVLPGTQNKLMCSSEGLTLPTEPVGSRGLQFSPCPPCKLLTRPSGSQNDTELHQKGRPRASKGRELMQGGRCVIRLHSRKRRQK